MSLEIAPLTGGDRAWARSLLRERWGSESIVTRGRIHRADLLPALVAWRDGARAGLLTYRLAGPECEIVSLDAVAPGHGVGSALIDAARRVAVDAGCRRLWLITTNDNAGAQRLYARLGFRLACLHGNALEESRRLKPSIPVIGLAGLPLRDELEYERGLAPSRPPTPPFTPRTGGAA
jgi:ribosomal protein S18 acetylase RimI-like enzyme